MRHIIEFIKANNTHCFFGYGSFLLLSGSHWSFPYLFRFQIFHGFLLSCLAKERTKKSSENTILLARILKLIIPYVDRENQFNKQCCLVTCLLIISIKRFWALWAIFMIYRPMCYNRYHGFAVRGYWTLWSNIVTY